MNEMEALILEYAKKHNDWFRPSEFWNATYSEKYEYRTTKATLCRRYCRSLAKYGFLSMKRKTKASNSPRLYKIKRGI